MALSFVGISSKCVSVRIHSKLLKVSAILLMLLPLSFSWKAVDPNQCTIVVDQESNAALLDGEYYPLLNTIDDCVNYCIDQVQSPACFAVEFDSKNASYGCYVHRTAGDKELYDNLNVTHYGITRDKCPSQANVDGKSSTVRHTASFIGVALSLFVAMFY